MVVERSYVFDGPEGKASLVDLFADRRQVIAYRAKARNLPAGA